MSRTRVLIVDDQKLFARSLKIVLEGHGKDEIEVVGIAYNGKEALALVEKTHPHVVLMDVRMPVMDGVEATRLVTNRFPEVNVMMLTTFDDDEYIHHALRNGAIGYLLKNMEPDDLITSIKAVQGGTFVISPSVGVRLFSHMDTATCGEGVSSKRAAEINYLLHHFPALSRREADVLTLIVQNMDNHEIAKKLFIAQQTVKNYTSRIYAKLGVTDRPHAIQQVKSLRTDP